MPHRDSTGEPPRPWLAAPMQSVDCWTPAVAVREGREGTLYLEQRVPLPAYPRSIGDILIHWAEQAPDRTLFAARNAQGLWCKLSYREVLSRVRALGQFLIDCRLSATSPLVILSGNDLEHALLSLGALYCGIPYAAISPAYSLTAPDYGRLREALSTLNPGLLFAADAERFRPAIRAAAPQARQLFARGASSEEQDFASASSTLPTSEVEQAHAAVTGDTIAKFLFTSGSTGTPKAVTNTHRMICSNQSMIREVFSFFKTEPPLLLDWAPWHHTGGGNKIFHMAMFNGGTLYIDSGRPTLEGINQTVENLKDVMPNWYFNIPIGFEILIPHLERDLDLRERFFRKLKLLWCAGAAMEQRTWEALDRLSVETTGRRILIATGFGATETAPAAVMCTWPQPGPGTIGLPCPGISLKLVPIGEGYYDARIKGPNVTPGYWNEPELSRNAFDEEGFYRLNDAVSFADPTDANRGLRYAGRTNENFKLNTATWVRVGTLRRAFLDHFGPVIEDVALAGYNRSYVAALVFPKWDQLARLAGAEARADPSLLRTDANVRSHFQAGLRGLAKLGRGSSTRIRRLILVDPAPSPLHGEITDKGTLNQAAVLRNRREWVEELYSGSDRVIQI